MSKEINEKILDSSNSIDERIKEFEIKLEKSNELVMKLFNMVEELKDNYTDKKELESKKLKNKELMEIEYIIENYAATI